MTVPAPARADMASWSEARPLDAGAFFTRSKAALEKLWARLFPPPAPAIAVPPLVIAPIDAQALKPKPCASEGILFAHNDLRSLDAGKLPAACTAATPKARCVPYRCLSGKWHPESDIRKRAKKKK